MDELNVRGHTFTVQRANAHHLPAIIRLLHDDPLGQSRETEDLAPYERAFKVIDDDRHQHLACIVDSQEQVVGTMQLTLIPGLSRSGASRLQIEGVRVAENMRGLGLGKAMFAWAHNFGRQWGAQLVQLTTDKTRADAHHFYEALGYNPTHEGFKRSL